MARTPNDTMNGHMGSQNGGSDGNTEVLQAAGQDMIDLPSADFVANADITRDGQDLILEAPDGSVIIIEGYFAAEPQPTLLSPEGQALTPQLVDSFVHHAGPVQYANASTLSDESPVGAVQELSGKATVTRTNGTTEEITIGTHIFQGDIIETDDEGAVNIVFIDETSFAVSENARLAIDEYVFDPGTESGSSNFSILRGVFVFTSGLIGRDDPDDVTIDTPVGSIGIRGTTIAGSIDPEGDSQITVVEGAIVVRNATGEQTLSTQFETVSLTSYTSEMQYEGTLDSTSIDSSYGSVETVSPDTFLAADETAPAEDPALAEEGTTTEEPATTEDPVLADATQEPAPEDSTVTEDPALMDGTQEPAPEGDTTLEPAPTGDTTLEPAPEGDTTLEPAPTGDSTQDPIMTTDTSFDGSDTTSFDGTGSGTFDGGGTTDTTSGTTDTSGTSGPTSTTSGTSGGTGDGSGATAPPPPPLDIAINKFVVDDNLDTAPADVVAVVETTYNFTDVHFELIGANISGADAMSLFHLVDGTGNKAAIKLNSNADIFNDTDTLSFTVKATLPDGRTVTETYNMSVDNLSGPAPVLDLDGSTAGTDFATSFTEDGGTVFITNTNLSITDPDSTNMSGATVRIMNLKDGAAESLTANTSGTSITASYDAATGLLTLSGTDTATNYENVLKSILYNNSSDSPDTTTRDIAIKVFDGISWSNIAHTSLTVNDANDAPTGTVNISGTASENQTLITTNTLADADGMGAITYQWMRDGTDITGATGNSYTLGDADVGASISVKAIYTDGGGTVETVTSASTGTVANVNDAPVGPVTITGSTTNGGTLTADTSGLSDADGLGAFSYQWQSWDGAAWTNIGTNSASYTLTAAEVGDNIKVAVSYTDGQGTVENVTSGPTTAITSTNTAPTGTAAISGTAQEDATLTADISGISDADGLTGATYSYQWQAWDGSVWTNIGTDSSTYTLSDADVGKDIRYQVTYTDDLGTTETVTSTTSGTVANVNDAPTGAVNVTGTVQEDATLTADTSSIVDADGLSGATFTYQWQSWDGSVWSNIGGANSASYTLSDADVGKDIRVEVSYTDDNGTAETITSTPTGTVANVNDAPTGGVSITGTAQEDQVLTADTSALVDTDGLSGATFNYQWQASTDGGTTWTNVGTNSANYSLSDGDVGHNIRVKVSYTDDNGTNEIVESGFTAPVTNVNDTPTGSVNITGTAQEDATLTADTSGINDADGMGTFSYQWEASNDGGSTWNVIGGATGASYTLGDVDVGNNIRVKVSYTDGHGTVENLTSSQTTAISNVNDAVTGSVSITGTVQEDQVLTADTSGLADGDGLGTYNYNWEASNDGGSTWTAIGTNSANYTLSDGDVGSQIRVTVSYTDGHGTGESVTSGTTGAVANVNDTPTGAVAITGTAQEGSTLTADTSAILDNDGMSGATFSYQWEISNDGGTTWTTIAGETSASFTPDDAEAGKELRVKVSYTDDNGTTENLVSPSTGTIASVDDAPTLNTNTGITDAMNFEEGDDMVLTTAMLSSSDVDTANTNLIYTVTSLPLYGKIFVSGTELAINGTFTQQDLIDGNVVYHHDGSASSDDTINTADDAFAFDVSDGTTAITSNVFEINIQLSSVPQLHNLANRPDDGFVISGSPGSMTGSAVAAMGDLNDDGFEDYGVIRNGTGDDVLATDGGTLLGGPNTTLDGTGKMSISGIGDFDGDGDLDYIVGQDDAHNLDTAAGFTGNAQVIDSSGSIVTQLNGGLTAGDQYGYSVAGVGDVNGDGLSDILIGAPGSDALGTDGGAAHLFYGNTGGLNLDVTADDYTITDSTGQKLGTNVSGMGDFNNDGFADFMVSAPGAGGADTGTLYLYKGGASGPSFMMTPLTNINVETGGDIPIFYMGDMNGDGISDIAYADTLNDTVHLLYGGNSPDTTTDVTIQADSANNMFIDGGGSVGDFNGDGHDDAVFVVRSTVDHVAEVFVLYGKAGMPSNITLTQAMMDDPSKGFVMDYDLSFLTNPDDPFSFEISSAGDTNGDGFDDLLIGTPDANGGDGEALVVYGRDDMGTVKTAYDWDVDGTPEAIANQNNDHLVGSDTGGNDYLTDFDGVTAYGNVSMNGGAGDDILEIHDLGGSIRYAGNLGNIDGGTGYDTLKFFGAGDTLDFGDAGIESLSGIEEIQLMDGGSQLLKLGIDDVFHLLQESSTNTLKISDMSAGNTTLYIDNNNGTPSEGLNMGPTNMGNLGFTGGTDTNSDGYIEWNFGSYQLLIDANIDTTTIV